MHLHSDDAAKAQFRNGLWFTVAMVMSMVRVISTEKATGMGAVAGGLSEGLATFGLGAIIISQVMAGAVESSIAVPAAFGVMDTRTKKAISASELKPTLQKRLPCFLAD